MLVLTFLSFLLFYIVIPLGLLASGIAALVAEICRRNHKQKLLKTMCGVDHPESNSMFNAKTLGPCLSKKHPIICISGSTRFKDEFYRLHKELTLRGFIAIIPAIYGKSGDEVSPEQQSALYNLHLDIIALCDIFFVINKHGYLGDSTRSEIQVAERLGKPVVYMERLKVGSAAASAPQNEDQLL